MIKKLSFFVFCMLSLSVFGQETKTINAKRITTAPKIDGVLDDQVWKDIPASGNFFKFRPGTEGEIKKGYETEIKMAYDDKAVYFAAYLYDANPETILKQFSQRDDVGGRRGGGVQADNFVIALNTYNDGINETRFYITSAGTIGDAIVSQGRQDFNYNVVFDAKISYDQKGWYAEFKIPYNALRFPEVKVQDWSVNFYRRHTTLNETHSWNLIDREVGQQTLYNGIITGVEDINPPVRLTLFPFVQGAGTDFDGKSETDFSIGLDVKYGLSDSFTLDATLIPDFGQTTFDNVTLNLGPFEQTFAENRQFFTEGVDLFNKGRLFFSRRIGNGPLGSVGVLEDNERLEDFPVEVDLLNAIKISGRTSKKLGVGFFNAITKKTYATIKNTDTDEIRKVLVEPLTNYNILVIDQQFNNNSSVSLINTNVTRNGSGFRDSNVTAAVFNVANKQNSYRVSGRAVFSNVNLTSGTKSGFLSELDIAKVKGKFRYRIEHDLADEKIDINDLGLMFRNNFNDFEAGASYQIFKPTKLFNFFRIGLTARHQRRYRSPAVQTANNIRLNGFFSTPKRFSVSANFDVNSKDQDFFEPRVEGRHVTRSSVGGGGTFSSDFRKKFSYNGRFGFRTWAEDPQENLSFSFSPRYRFSDNFLLVIGSTLNLNKNQFGFVSKTSDNQTIFFGQRDVTNLENTITASYNFDSYKAINLRFRHFWSTADYSDNIFSVLNDDGSRTVIDDFDITQNNPNRNFNIWNIDLTFRWRFAPGSEATLLYRNEFFNRDNLSTLNYNDSLKNLLKQPSRNTLSLRITYFIDYNNVKHIFKKNS